MKELEVSARTVDEATQTALEQLGVSEDQVEVIVLTKGKSGVLGMGTEEARIKVRLLPGTGGKDDVVEVAEEVLKTLIEFMGISFSGTSGQIGAHILREI